MTAASQSLARPKRIRFWHNGVKWYARASFMGYVPVGSGSTPEAALVVLGERILKLRDQIERDDPGARLWESAWARAKRDTRGVLGA